MTSIQKLFFNASLTFLLSFLNGIGFSQVFDWYDDGYIYNNSLYYDIDNSGIDIEIIGLTGGSWTDNTVGTGINGNGNNGVQHAYTFKFSQLVDVEFEVKRINRDTTGGFCYNDQLIFPDNPQFISSSEVTIVGDTVFALWGGTVWSGSVRVRYENVDSLTFFHGEGVGCDPGSVRITPLIINDNTLDSEAHSISDFKLLVIDECLILKNLTELPKRIEIYNSFGQSISYMTEMNDHLTIKLQSAVSGLHFVAIELPNGNFIRKKVFLN